MKNFRLIAIFGLLVTMLLFLFSECTKTETTPDPRATFTLSVKGAAVLSSTTYSTTCQVNKNGSATLYWKIKVLTGNIENFSVSSQNETFQKNLEDSLTITNVNNSEFISLICNFTKDGRPVQVKGGFQIEVKEDTVPPTDHDVVFQLFANLDSIPKGANWQINWQIMFSDPSKCFLNRVSIDTLGGKDYLNVQNDIKLVFSYQTKGGKKDSSIFIKHVYVPIVPISDTLTKIIQVQGWILESVRHQFPGSSWESEPYHPCIGFKYLYTITPDWKLKTYNNSGVRVGDVFWELLSNQTQILQGTNLLYTIYFLSDTVMVLRNIDPQNNNLLTEETYSRGPGTK